jgi:hypothetical protein
MAAKLSQGVVDKIKSEFPALNINQIAGKYGVTWARVNSIVAPSDGAARKKRGRKPRAQDDGELAIIGAHVDAFWNQMSLAAKVQFLIGGK